jgi:hypothetical protein
MRSLRHAAATERDVRYGMEFPQCRRLHALLASGLIPDVRVVVEQLPRDFDARGMGQMVPVPSRCPRSHGRRRRHPFETPRRSRMGIAA